MLYMKSSVVARSPLWSTRSSRMTKVHSVPSALTSALANCRGRNWLKSLSVPSSPYQNFVS